jgi:hypothetical protein
MRPARHLVARGKGASLLLVCLLLGACHSRSPNVEFSRVPPADAGGPDKLDTIEGRVKGARPGQQIVLYARSEGLWWIQPFSNRPFTKIQGDSSWKSQTHLGTEYAALLVTPDTIRPARARYCQPSALVSWPCQ